MRWMHQITTRTLKMSAGKPVTLINVFSRGKQQ
jgi:hypothetical protein